MEEFAQGGRLSPKKVKEFIPAGTLGIGEDKNIWLRKARKDGATYWDEFLETWNYSRFIPKGYDLTLGIHFRAEPKTDEKFGFDLKYGYYQEGGGFILDVYYADTQLTYAKHETFDVQQFRDDCIYVRDNLMPNDPLMKYEFSEIVGKLTSAFERGELRKDFTEETPEPTPEPREPLEPLFEVGDFVRVKQTGYHIPFFEEKKVEYKFDKPTEYPNLEEGDEGYIVGYFEDDADGEMEIVYVVKNQSKIGTINLEFLIGGEGLQLIRKAPKIAEEVLMNDMNFLYPSAPSIKEKLRFDNPEQISVQNEVFMSYGRIFTKGQDPYTLMPIYGIYSAVLEQEVLMGIKGFELDARIDPLKNKKIKINNAEENSLVQKYAFELGYVWLGVERNVVQEFDSYPAYLEFDEILRIFALEFKDFEELKNEETTLKELGLLGTDAPRPMPEFHLGDYVEVVESAYVMKNAVGLFDEFKFINKDTNDAKNGYKGLVIGFDQNEYLDGWRTYYVVREWIDGNTSKEFVIQQEGLKLLQPAPEKGTEVKIIDWEYIYGSNRTEVQRQLGFNNPYQTFTRGQMKQFDGKKGKIFGRTVDTKDNFMPIYGVEFEDGQQVLIGWYGFETENKPTQSEPPKPSIDEEFICNVDASKINSAYVGSFYSKNKERINKLNSEFSCKILEALVYLSDYEKCGGGVELPNRELEEEDDLLGAIRNLK